MTKIFVYGTLKGSHGYLRTATFLGEFVTEPRYSLYSRGIPYLQEDGVHSIQGEVWEVDRETLASLDSLEGHPDWYNRRPVSLVEGPEGVEGYIYPHEIDDTYQWVPRSPGEPVNWRR